eukprot:TRINITY_DN356_c0_g1_i1.p2 TRINITY_DN356_c0_g1~~TRINITY_DN356_c0_g1_i1.p2  ORF type:complete len:175 (+),score=74.75 TRINITY_DN356_c0_g1_i1:26-526(+)
MASLGKCRNCKKTVYPLEGFTAVNAAFHKGCFKCDTCGWQLTLQSYKNWGEGIYCQSHMPVTGFGTTHVTGNQSTKDKIFQNAVDAPKLDTVNQQIRGVGKNSQVPDMAAQTAINAPKLDVINEQIRGTGKNSQVPDLTHQTAVSAPKLGNVNEQIRGAAPTKTEN